MIDDGIIESLVKIGNHPSVIKLCEPNICYPFQLESWMVKRTLVARGLMEKQELTEEWIESMGNETKNL